MVDRMHSTILRAIGILFLSGSLIACGGESVGVDDAVIDSENNANKLQQLLMVLTLTDAENNYVAVEKIDSVKLKINGQPWGTFPSEPLDLEGIATTTVGNLNVTDQEVSYLAIAQYTVTVDSLTTAGEYASYLHNRLRIAPGDYICEIAEIKFRDAQNNTVTVKPRVFRSFTVEPNTASLSLGEIAIKVR